MIETSEEIKTIQYFERIYKEMNGVDQGIVLSKLYLDLKEKNHFVDFVNWERKRT